MSCPKSSINDDLPINDVIRRAVRAEIKGGNNWMGATATLALYLDVSPRMIRARCKEELVGASRLKRDLVEGCWDFIEMVARRQAAFAEGEIKDVARHRGRREQLMLPLHLPESGTLPGRMTPVPMRDVAVDLARAANVSLARAKSA